MEVKIEERKASPYKRSEMPALSLPKRKGNYEETNLGLPEDMARKEAGRCLNCAICCECMECEQACEVKAVFHHDTTRLLEIEATKIINFISQDQNIKEIKKPGIVNVSELNDGNMPGELAQAAAIASSVAIDFKSIAAAKQDIKSVLAVKAAGGKSSEEYQNSGNRTAVFLCHCGDSISSVVDFNKVTRAISKIPDVYSIRELPQSCTKEASQTIKAYVEKEKIAHVVLAACRCCNLEQICFSCTDRRVMCQNNLSIELPQGVNIEYVNIREQCAWIHKDDPIGATQKAIEIISTGVSRSQKLLPVIHETRPIMNSALIISTGLSGLAAARDLAIQHVDMIFISEMDDSKLKKHPAGYRKNADMLLNQLAKQGVKVNPWPDSLELNGGPGRYEAVVKYNSKISRIEAGVVILDLMNAKPESLKILTNSNLISRVMATPALFNAGYPVWILLYCTLSPSGKQPVYLLLFLPGHLIFREQSLWAKLLRPGLPVISTMKLLSLVQVLW